MRKASEAPKPTLLTNETTATFRVSRDLLAEFKQLALANERSFSQQLRWAMAEMLERETERETA